MSDRTCSFSTCDYPAHARGLCSGHYGQQRSGAPLTPIKRRLKTLEDRFWAKVDRTDGCWNWTGAKNHLGYGQIQISRKVGRRGAHRLAYELLIAPIPAWATDIDHLCRNPSCVNPEHLEPVTHAENMRRAPWSAIQFQSAKTHCPSGHAYDADNTYLNPRGSRECRRCRAETKRRHVARKKPR